MNSLITVTTFSLLPTAAMSVAGALATFRTPGPAWRSAILHFGAGVIFSVAAVELLPEVMREHRPLEVCLGFGLGVAVMLGLRQAAHQLQEGVPRRETARALPLGMLFGIGVDVLVDGLLLGIAFAAGAKAGLLVTLALTIEAISLGLTTVAALASRLRGRAEVIRVTSGIACGFMVGAVGGGTFFGGMSSHNMAVVLSFGLAALLFLVTEELLVEAHQEPETPLLTASFFGGFLLFLLLGMLT
jgi:ZIP family zinc transporter